MSTAVKSNEFRFESRSIAHSDKDPRSVLRLLGINSVMFVIGVAALFSSCLLCAQTSSKTNPTWLGDSLAETNSPAKDISKKISKQNVSHAMQKVADWQLRKSEAGFSRDWTFATLYIGFMAVPEEAGGRKYSDAMVEMGKKFSWEPGSRISHADDHAVSQTYLELYNTSHDALQLAPTAARMNAVMKIQDNPETPLWWWCDALFMAPPVFAKLSNITGDPSYLQFMDKEWNITSNLLYSQKDHLFSRDKSFLDQHEKNGKSLYWSRGNGWVMAGLVRVLQQMPKNYPSRQRYLNQFKEMSDEIASIQGSDGLWRPGLLDPDAYQLPEVSGSSFYTYALAYGINEGILDRKRYFPVVAKAWSGITSHIYEDGRLGCIQPIGAAPGDYTPTDSYVYGTGAFLLAGSEVYRLARK